MARSSLTPCHHFVVSSISRILTGFPQDQLYLDLVEQMAIKAVELASDKLPTLAIAGSQGTGKSTLAAGLQQLLADKHGQNAVIISLDDFYLTKAARQILAKDVHPLLETRGVPGTHDLAAMMSALTALRSGQPVTLPVFDKAIDDRSDQTQLVESTDVIICEGWCWGAVPEPEMALETPINVLESGQDSDGRWRRFVNDQLLSYQPAFASDVLLFLQVPSMQSVLDWRWQQEQELAANSGSGMDQDQVAAFIQYYERLTRWMLAEMPARADLTAVLGVDHNIVKVEAGTDSGSIQ